MLGIRGNIFLCMGIILFLYFFIFSLVFLWYKFEYRENEQNLQINKEFVFISVKGKKCLAVILVLFMEYLNLSMK